MTLLKLAMNHFKIMVLCKKANLFISHCFIRCRFPITIHLNNFECLCVSSSNDNYKVLILLHLGMHIERGGPHTPCSHAKEQNNVIGNQLHKCNLKNFRCVLQITLEPIPLQECMPFSSDNGLLLIATKVNQGHQ